MPLNRTRTPKGPIPVVEADFVALAAGFSTTLDWVGLWAGFVSVANEVLGTIGALTDDCMADIRLDRV
jgi:hypothetical protein